MERITEGKLICVLSRGPGEVFKYPEFLRLIRSVVGRRAPISAGTRLGWAR